MRTINAVANGLESAQNAMAQIENTMIDGLKMYEVRALLAHVERAKRALDRAVKGVKLLQRHHSIVSHDDDVPVAVQRYVTGN